MVRRLEIRPATAGVVYSPAGSGWQFFPEPTLYVGFTGGQPGQTVVRSVLTFPLPDLADDDLLVRAWLYLRLVYNEPLYPPKLVCLRETPNGAMTPWSLEQEYRQAVVAEHHLTSELEIDLDFPLTAMVTAWRRGAPNNGILLDYGHQTPGLVGFCNGWEYGPRLRLEYVVPAKDAAVISLEAAADGTATSRDLPCRVTLVRNLGPGLAWITPLYRVGGAPPQDPSGIPLGVLDPGNYLLVEPRLPARSLAIRVEATLEPATVVIVPIVPEVRAGEGGG